MTTSAASSSPIVINELETTDAVLKNRTQDLLPGVAAQIQGASLSSLDKLMSDLITKATASNLKDKELTKVLGTTAMVATAQLKLSHKRFTDKSDEQTKEITELQQEFVQTKQEFTEAKRELTKKELKKTKLTLTNAEVQTIVLKCQLHSQVEENSKEEEKIELQKTNERLKETTFEQDDELNAMHETLREVTQQRDESQDLLKQVVVGIKDIQTQVKSYAE